MTAYKWHIHKTSYIDTDYNIICQYIKDAKGNTVFKIGDMDTLHVIWHERLHLSMNEYSEGRTIHKLIYVE